MMLAVLAAALVGAASPTLTPPPPASLDGPALVSWYNSYVEQGPFEYLSDDDQKMVLISTAAFSITSAATVRTLVRSEYFNPQTVDGQAVRSAIVNIEVDCHEDRVRNLGFRWYPYNNLRGPERDLNIAAPEWVYAVPQTLGLAEVDHVCNLVREAQKQSAAEADTAPAEPSVHWSVQKSESPPK